MGEGKKYTFLDRDTSFKGVIATSSLVLEGSISGEVKAEDRVVLKEGSRVSGEIRTKTILVEDRSVPLEKIRFRWDPARQDAEKSPPDESDESSEQKSEDPATVWDKLTESREAPSKNRSPKQSEDRPRLW